MAEDKIDSFIDRTGIKGDEEFILKSLNAILDKINTINKTKVELAGTKTFKDAGEAAAKLRKELEETEKLQKQLDTARIKRIQLEEQYNKETIEGRELLRQRNQELKNQVREQNAAQGSIEQMRAALIRLNKEYDNLSEADRNSASGQGLKTQVKAVSDELKKLEGETGRFQRSVGNYSGAVKTLEKALQDIRSKMDDYNKTGKVSAETLESLVREEQLLAQLVNSQTAGFASASQEIRKNEQALIELAAAGKQNTSYYQELIQQTANLKDNVGDLKEEIRNLASDTGTLDGLIQGAETLAGTYAIAQGTAALFGEENEELAQTFVKLQAVTTILNGLQAIRNALQSQSSLMLLVEKGRTLALAAAQRILAFATSGATAAMRAMNGVLLAGGLTAVLVLLPMVVSAMSSLGDETDDTTESLEDQTKAVEELNQAYLKAADSSIKMKNAQKGGLDDLRRELDLMQARGATESEQFEQRRKIMKEERDNLSQRLGAVIEGSDAEIEIRKEIADKENQIKADQIAYEKKMADESDKIAKERAGKAQEYAEKDRKAQFEILRLSIEEQIELRKKEADNPLNNPAKRLDERAKALELEKQLALASMNEQLRAEKLTVNERLLIRAQYAKKIKDLEQQTVEDILAIQAKITEQEKANRADILANAAASQEATLQKEIAAAEKSFTNRINYVRDLAEGEQAELIKAYEKGELTKEQYEERKLEIENRFRRASLLEEIKYQERLLQTVDLAPDAKAAAEEKLQELRRQIRADEIAEEERTVEKSIELQERRKEKMIELGNELKETAFAFITAGIDREKNAVQEQIDLLEQRKQREIEVANQTIASTQERADAIAVIEARANAQREQFERRKRQLDEQRARYERIKNIADIISNTALAVMGALRPDGVTPLPARIALAAVIGGIGAAQIARVLATPIPKFARGKSKHNTYEGFAEVGDGGKSEAIIREDGSVEITPDKPTLTYVKRGDIILPDAKDLAEQQFRMAINHTGRLVHGYQTPGQNNKNVERAIQGMRKDIVYAIKNIPQPIIQVPDKVRNWVRDGSEWRRL